MYKIEKQFKNVDDLIKWFKWFLIVLLFILILTNLLVYPYCWSINCISNFFNYFASITTKSLPLLAALVATFVADRHIIFTSKNRDFDHALEVQQVTHRYIAISKDLKNKINYLKKMFDDGGHNIHGFTTIIKSIEERYESLYEKEAYKYLDGKTIDKITSMSPSIFALIYGISTIKETLTAKSNQKFMPANFSPEIFDKLLETIDSILNDLYELKDNMVKKL